MSCAATTARWKCPPRNWPIRRRCASAPTWPTLRACNVYIVTVPTPIDTAKRPDLTPLVKASEVIGAC